jgi:regulatory protein
MFKRKIKKDRTSDGEERAPRINNPEKMRERAFQRAVNLLAAKPRSVRELRERLLEKNWTDEETVEAVIAKLEEYGYLNDEQFAYSYALSQLRQKPVGKGRIKRALALKKVESETVEAALEQVFNETSEEELIDRAIEKRVRLRGHPANRDETKKLFDHLLRRGFSYELVMRKVREISRSSVDEDESKGQRS